MQETVTISKKEYELLKKHQQEYGILLDTLADAEEECTNLKVENTHADWDAYIASLIFEQTFKLIGKKFKERLKENDTKF
jgi:hypothetical protein